MISIRDVTFKEDLFYNSKEPADHYDLQEVEEVTDSYEIPRLQQNEIEEWSDTDSEFGITNVHDTGDIQEEEESSHAQEQSLQNYTRRNYDNDNDFLPRAFPDDTELLTGGLEPTLPTPDRTPEPSNPMSISNMPKATKA